MPGIDCMQVGDVGFFTRPMLSLPRQRTAWGDLPLSGVIMLCGQVARWGPAHYLNSRPVCQRALSEKWAPPCLPGLLLGWLGGYFRTTRPRGGRFPPLYEWHVVSFCIGVVSCCGRSTGALQGAGHTAPSRGAAVCFCWLWFVGFCLLAFGC